MTETKSLVMPADLDRLAERVEKAATIVLGLRDERDRAVRERDDLAGRLKALEAGLQGHDAAALVQEVAALRKEQREWHGERREVATRIESLIRKLERIEG